MGDAPEPELQHARLFSFMTKTGDRRYGPAGRPATFMPRFATYEYSSAYFNFTYMLWTFQDILRIHSF
jgi:hypothetical protein